MSSGSIGFVLFIGNSFRVLRWWNSAFYPFGIAARCLPLRPLVGRFPGAFGRWVFSFLVHAGLRFVETSMGFIDAFVY